MDIGNIANKVFNILKGHNFRLRCYDEIGTEVQDIDTARYFFVEEPMFMVEVAEDQIRLDKNKNLPIEDIETVTKALKRISDEFLINYTIRNFNKKINPKFKAPEAKLNRDRKMKSDVNEATLSKLSGFRKTSYQTLGEVKIIYRHSRSVNEEVPSSRARNVSKIFLEFNDTRFVFPNNYILGARAFARHINEGGLVDDSVSKYILETSKRCVKMREFLRYANRNKALIEGNEEAVQLVRENLAQLRYDFKKFTAPTTYAVFREKFENSVVEMPDDVHELRDQFTVKSFDDKFESVLPYISSLLQEKARYERAIKEELSKDGLFNARPQYTTSVEFENVHQKLAFQLQETASVLESESLSVFLGRISEKIASQQALDEFEVHVVREVLNKAQESEFLKSSSN
jgi:hypothetical protein